MFSEEQRRDELDTWQDVVRLGFTMNREVFLSLQQLAIALARHDAECRLPDASAALKNTLGIGASAPMWSRGEAIAIGKAYRLAYKQRVMDVIAEK